MNRKYLGDALDHWKGSVINIVAPQNLRVLPMRTDHRQWEQENLSAYSRLLGRKPKDILRMDRIFSNKTREKYFSDLGNSDLFLDPDTGIAPDGRRQKKHISPCEIAHLLSSSRSRMLLIYQHASPNKNWIREKLRLLRSSPGLKHCGLFAYDSGTVAMLVISRDRKRVNKARARLESWLGPVASRRLTKAECRWAKTDS
jgi:hypothetical protein